MNKITVKISAIDKKKLNLKSNKIDFVDLERLIMLSAARENLKKVVNVARKTGLSKMTSKEIDAEIKPYRESSKAGNWYYNIKIVPGYSLKLLPDSSDDKFLELALSSQADFFITGNLRHFPMGRFESTEIISPEKYWNTYWK